MAVVTTSKVDDITAAKQAQAKKSATTDASSQLAGDFSNFLRLLTTQLKNQDPTQPLDTNQFTQQIASLSTVEQGINTNKNLEKLISLYNSSQQSSVVNYIGKRAEASGNESSLENGRAIFVYDLEKAADKLTVSITDSTGRVMFTGTGTKSAGRNQVVWDGVSSIDGSQAPDGTYKITVDAKDAAGKQIVATPFTSGRVTAVDMQNGKMTLSLGNIQVPLENVLSVHEEPTL